MSSYYSSSPRSVSSVLSIEFRQVGRLRRVAMYDCQRCLVCGCMAVSDVLCATADCVLKQRSQPAAVYIPLFNFLTIV